MQASALTTYIHPGGEIGVLVEVSCKSESAAHSVKFQELIQDIAMQIAASSPKFIRKEQVSLKTLEEEKERCRLVAASTGRQKEVVMKIVEGMIFKYFEELCLYEQPFIKDRTISIGQLIAFRVGEIGEDIRVRRFVRFKLGESDSTFASDFDSGPGGGDEIGFTANRPKNPKGGIGFDAVQRNMS